MISVVTAYFNRRKLLIRTLDSMNSNYGTIDFEFIVVDDGSEEEERLEDLQQIYPFLRIIRLEKSDKWYSNPCIPFNRGFEAAKGDKIILQNPECYHFDNILQYVDTHLNANEYLSFGCYSLDKKNTDDDLLFFERDHVASLIENNAHIVQTDGGLGWYNHSRYRPSSYHFCTAMMTSDLVDLGGFDPRYALGHGYDDDEFVFRVQQKRMHIQFLDTIKVIHQNHYVKQVSVDEQKEKYINENASRNKSIFNNITKNSLNYRVNFLTIGNHHQNNKQYVIPAIRNYFLKIKYKIQRKF
ncbi:MULTISPECIES: glycosyltransferase family 2 protein [unclassified Flavobacterium]|jgi:GT2 family glycosyltransferase|uniref:glycosyltransferase family 2 protein n=1 Tax=unclassified Flavobacterium TaxID=196869 RepID=UPI0025C60CAF|nr:MULTISPECIES: glycosyltransferase [unclassified Flavobacterium]